jgi:hypothetical protein
LVPFAIKNLSEVTKSVTCVVGNTKLSAFKLVKPLPFPTNDPVKEPVRYVDSCVIPIRWLLLTPNETDADTVDK